MVAAALSALLATVAVASLAFSPREAAMSLARSLIPVPVWGSFGLFACVFAAMMILPCGVVCDLPCLARFSGLEQGEGDNTRIRSRMLQDKKSNATPVPKSLSSGLIR